MIHLGRPETAFEPNLINEKLSLKVIKLINNYVLESSMSAFYLKILVLAENAKTRRFLWACKMM